MTQKQKILVVDDDAGIITTLRLLLKTEGFDVTTATQPAEALFFVKKQDFDIVLMDLNYSLDTTSGNEGLDLIGDIKKLDENLPIVVMTGWGTIDVAVQTMQQGAGDFVQKPWDNDRLLSILANQIKLGQSLNSQNRLNEENQLLKQALNPNSGGAFIGESASMKQLLGTVTQIAQTEISIIITGENGTGKSLLARHIHQQASTNPAGTNSQSFVAVNMGSITETLFESEMFGHVKGAFTDAKTQRIGRFELANNGTLFMDEIGNIPLSQQAKLLRVIEDQQFEKVGSSKTQSINVRIISATNADLADMVAQKTFRMDLLYRLNTIELKIPPLRERIEDIPLLANQFIVRLATKYNKRCPALGDDAIVTLQQYDWPGNIRELSHCLERVVLLCADSTITAAQLMLPNIATPSRLEPATQTANREQAFDDTLSLDDIDKQVIITRLNKFKGNAVEAAKSLGLSRSAFYRRLEKYGI
ncbi:MAG: sigma-54-dependent Fis family transcriptional regulator [Algicola sp.]|nr:sigma-54-dependent Fis family transcriptional regulator [Algicola sp.]